MGISGGYVRASHPLHPHSLSYKANVLVDNNGRARLADFGLLTIISDEPTVTSTAIGAAMAYWMSPELLSRRGLD